MLPMRTGTQTELAEYLHRIMGNPVALIPVKQQETPKLPLFLRDRYKLLRGDLFGRKCYFAVVDGPNADFSAADYTRDAAALEQGLFTDVVLVPASLSAYVRNALVRQHVPFIVPNTQMFLPKLMTNLTERFPTPQESPSNTLSSVAQLIIIYQILQEPVGGLPLKHIADKLGYSAMTLSRAQDELQNAQLCDVERYGNALSLRFKWSGKALWQRAEPLLSTPVKREQWIRWGNPRPNAVKAGITALSTYTMLADESVATYAMRSKHVASALEQGEIIGCRGRGDAEACMQLWKYDPFLLAKNDMVDPCSLYLSLRHSADERVQKELDTLINEFIK
jgi:hypothetical protein